jgi:hypothetical protein
MSKYPDFLFLRRLEPPLAATRNGMKTSRDLKNGSFGQRKLFAFFVNSCLFWLEFYCKGILVQPNSELLGRTGASHFGVLKLTTKSSPMPFESGLLLIFIISQFTRRGWTLVVQAKNLILAENQR